MKNLGLMLLLSMSIAVAASDAQTGGISGGAANGVPPAGVETGTLAASDVHEYFVNAYPVIDRLAGGRLLCVFAVEGSGTPRKLKDAFSFSDDNGKTWSRPSVLFDHAGAEDADPSLLVDGNRVMAFSTTLPTPGKIEKSLIYMRESEDGVHWGEESLLKTPHKYISGKIHQGHRLSDGTLIFGYSWDTWAEQDMPPSTEGEMNIKAGVMRSTDNGRTWTAGGDMYADVAKTSPHATSGLGEPATVVLKDGRLMALMRAPGTKLFQAWSNDGGRTWSAPRASRLTAHNSPAALLLLRKSGKVLVAWDNSATARTPLAVAFSADGGHTWSPAKIIVDSPGFQVSYPSITQASDGAILVVWQQQLPSGGREIRTARFGAEWLSPR